MILAFVLFLSSCTEDLSLANGEGTDSKTQMTEEEVNTTEAQRTNNTTEISNTPKKTNPPEWDGEFINFTELGTAKGLRREDCERKLHLIKTREEMLDIYRDVPVNEFSKEIPEPDNKYDEEYFSKNYIIMFSNLTTQTIDQVLLKESKLILYRTFTDFTPPANIMYYHLVEVDNTNLEKINNLSIYSRWNISNEVGNSYLTDEDKIYKLYLEINVE